MDDRETIDAQFISTLAKVANVELDKSRVANITNLLSVWINEANDLSKKMSQQSYWTTVPITVFKHF